jgi:hypothetical protein
LRYPESADIIENGTKTPWYLCQRLLALLQLSQPRTAKVLLPMEDRLLKTRCLKTLNINHDLMDTSTMASTRSATLIKAVALVVQDLDLQKRSHLEIHEHRRTVRLHKERNMYMLTT